ncbi:butyrophilin-like protein 3 isoform X2 [Poecilia reticulata]|uniref:butyrophilin-like protein 3 isoform X2 n=1 Tax=Poecilia reticulata TaxID=8081 RepID=UPI0007EA7FE5|nr:PREDICTED: butyrophilin-like protein 3 isoform X2 [Poecilia reticulata]
MNFFLIVLNTQTTMVLLLLLSVCVLTYTGQTFGDKNVPCVNAAAGSDAILNCKLPVNTHQIFDWKKTDTSPAQEVFLYERGSHYNNGKSGQNEHFIKRVEFFEDQLQFGNASIRIKNTKLTDSGIYSCEFPKLDLPELKTYVKLVVGTKPTIRIVKDENGAKRVECKVRGPSTQLNNSVMELQNSKNINVAAETPKKYQDGNYFAISLEAVVTTKGHYHCVVKQEESCYQISSDETLVDLLSGSSKGLIHGGLLGVGVLISIAFATVL